MLFRVQTVVTLRKMIQNFQYTSEVPTFGTHVCTYSSAVIGRSYTQKGDAERCAVSLKSIRLCPCYHCPA